MSVAGLLSMSGLVAAHAQTGAPGTAGATTDIRLVAGNRPVIDHDGMVWASDVSYATGGWTTPNQRVIGADDPALFATERVNLRSYHIPVPAAGTYRVTLNDAEAHWTRPGQRVFSVTAEGATVADGVDILAHVGRFRPYQLTFDVPVTDGALDLGFTNYTDFAKVTSLRVVSTGQSAPDGPTQSVDVPNAGSTQPAGVTEPTPAASKPGATTAPALSGPTPASTTDSPVSPHAEPFVSPEQFGARGDGVTDDTAALQRAFDSAAAGTAVLLSRTYAHNDLLHLRTDNLHVTGTGTLLATEEARSSVWVEANDVLVDGDLTVKTQRTTKRWSAWEQMGVRILGHHGVVLRGLHVVGSAAAGIYVGNQASSFVLDHVTVRGSRADGIHMTGGAHDGQVIAPTTANTGDDGVAVVSYGGDGAPCHDITVSSPRVLGTTWGRGLSVVGGTNITETDVHVERTSAAGIYIAAEGKPWFTAAPQNVMIDGGTITGTNTDPGVDHGAVLVMSGQVGPTPTDVTVRGLSIIDTRATATRNVGVISYGTAPQGIQFEDLSIIGGPRSAYQGNAPATSYQTRGWVQDGIALPDHG